MRVCVCVRMCVCVYVYVCVCLRVRVCVCIPNAWQEAEGDEARGLKTWDDVFAANLGQVDVSRYVEACTIMTISIWIILFSPIGRFAQLMDAIVQVMDAVSRSYTPNAIRLGDTPCRPFPVPPVCRFCRPSAGRVPDLPAVCRPCAGFAGRLPAVCRPCAGRVPDV